MTNLVEVGKAAKKGASKLAISHPQDKDKALVALAALLRREQAAILEANRQDLEEAQAAGMSPAMLDRLSLEGRIDSMADDVLAVVKLADPVGEVIYEKILPNGLKATKVRTPIGVVGVLYESRPNVTVDVAALAIKSGNCAILRGGREALRTNKALVKVISEALQQASLPPHAVQFIEETDRAFVMELLKLHRYVDLIIPRGGDSLQQFCRENSTIPVITGGIGICHLYVDDDVDVDAVIPVIDNAKTQRPTVCNALDTVLVHAAVAERLLPPLIQRLADKGVTFCVDVEAMPVFEGALPVGFDRYRVAKESDWDTEWLGLTLGIKIVNSLDEAMDHIALHSSGHSDGILTRNQEHAKRFVQVVDSSAVYVNASTRFTDGGQLGLGAEIAVSTQKLHARGPMGLVELTTYKWVVWGHNHVR